MICKHHRMGLWKKNSGEAFGVMMGMILVVISMVQAQNGHVTIVNSFYGPTRFTCHSNKMNRQGYTAVYREAYYFAFDTIAGGHQFWDCQVSNKGWGLLGEFRFWGDASHGGPGLGNCDNCSWSVEDSGVYMYVDGGWRLKYIWNR